LKQDTQGWCLGRSEVGDGHAVAAAICSHNHSGNVAISDTGISVVGL